MRKRIKLKDRLLPDYTFAEEITNMVSHIAGSVLGVVALILCILTAVSNKNVYGIVGSGIYGGAMIALYSVSSIYHGLRPGMGKLVMQVLDHCTIYFLIAGTYTVIAMSALRPLFPGLGWGMLIFQWTLAALAITLTAIDLKKYSVFSMICYIGMGWAIAPFIPQTIRALSYPGFMLLLSGGISYTIGAVLYGIGSKVHWMHSVFHIFVVMGSLLHFLSILFYAL